MVAGPSIMHRPRHVRHDWAEATANGAMTEPNGCSPYAQSMLQQQNMTAYHAGVEVPLEPQPERGNNNNAGASATEPEQMTVDSMSIKRKDDDENSRGNVHESPLGKAARPIPDTTAAAESHRHLSEDSNTSSTANVVRRSQSTPSISSAATARKQDETLGSAKVSRANRRSGTTELPQDLTPRYTHTGVTYPQPIRLTISVNAESIC